MVHYDEQLVCSVGVRLITTNNTDDSRSCTPLDTRFCPQFIKPSYEGLHSFKNLGWITYKYLLINRELMFFNKLRFDLCEVT
jgi:hypothetical protein